MSSRSTLVPAALATLAALAAPRSAVADAGCYSITDFPFNGLGVDIPDEFIATDSATSPAAAAALFCRALPATIDSSVLSSFESEDSFEGADPLATWTLDTSADPDTAIRVICVNDAVTAGSAAGTAFLVGAAPTFTDLLDAADDGVCAAIVRAGCSEIMGDYGTPGTNSMSRQFRVFNRGCVEAEMAYQLMFAVAFDDRERCEVATVNDTVMVSVETGLVSEVAAEFVSCAEGDSPKWVTVTVDLGVVPLGTVITPTFVVESTNDEDCFLDSFVAIDDIRIMPKK